mmetsp:Transcript_11549/g.17067  ORF Transcript_11549/g.17067 Transcript_11549/m.17067 type:complete len:297 (-) Transcript_11549:1153-2043(-)
MARATTIPTSTGAPLPTALAATLARNAGEALAGPMKRLAATRSTIAPGQFSATTPPRATSQTAGWPSGVVRAGLRSRVRVMACPSTLGGAPTSARACCHAGCTVHVHWLSRTSSDTATTGRAPTISLAACATWLAAPPPSCCCAMWSTWPCTLFSPRSRALGFTGKAALVRGSSYTTSSWLFPRVTPICRVFPFPTRQRRESTGWSPAGTSSTTSPPPPGAALPLVVVVLTADFSTACMPCGRISLQDWGWLRSACTPTELVCRSSPATQVPRLLMSSTLCIRFCGGCMRTALAIS